MKVDDSLMKKVNPIIQADFPDPDILRVDDTYYMMCSTIHFLPGAVILRSYDLLHWEIASYVFDTFEGTEEAKMTNERSNYGCGMWAGSLRYHKGRFYVSFAAKATCKTYFYSAEKVEGPWEMHSIDFYFHEGSLFFDEDDRVYLIFGHRELWIRELLPDLSGLKPGGFAKKILDGSRMDLWLGYEGTHFYKINGKYYLLILYWPKDGTARRTQLCYVAHSLDADFVGKVVLDDDLGYFNNGIAQGGLVDTNDGRWFSVLFQDRGALGRAPVLVPVTWENDFPVFGTDKKAPREVANISNRPYYKYAPLYTSDDFRYEELPGGGYALKPQWQWNHEPNRELWNIAFGGGLWLTTGKICTNVSQAVNTLTQKLFGPKSAVSVTVDASDLNEGDYAGLVALQGCYGMIAITRELRRYYLVLIEREDNEKNRNTRMADYMPGIILEKISLNSPQIHLRMEADFTNSTDKIQFFYREPRQGEKWIPFGKEHQTYFGLDHFAGCRAGLSIFATKKAGGSAVFRDFEYEHEE